MEKITKLLLPIILISFPGIVFAQNIISGRVTDVQTGEPLIGVSVIVKGDKTHGVITDADGNFNLKTNSDVPLSLSAEYIGYRSQQIDVYDTEEPLIIKLRENSKFLSGIVVVGYGNQRREQLTGSVSTVGSDIFSKSPSPTLDIALGGQVAGLNVTASSGQPGAASQIRIRGGNSVNASNEPLYVIDGFIYYKDGSSNKTGLGAIGSSLSPLSSINPQDIESIEVLKDVSATAIYGSRGANGVIIVTTKKGSSRKTNINYRYSAGFDVMAKKLNLLNAEDWARLEKDYFYNKGGYTDDAINALGKGTDWQDAVTRTAFHQSHELSINGGSDKEHFAFSASYTDQDGIIINSGFNRYNFHINYDRELLKGLSLGVNASYGRSKQEGLSTTEAVAYNSSPYSAGITNSFVYALLMPPVVPVYNSDGSFNYKNPYEYAYFAIGNQTANPVSDLTNSVAESINQYLLANTYLKYKFGDFTAKASLGISNEHITQNYFSPSYTALGLSNKGVGGIGNKTNEIVQQEYTLDYTKSINSIHFINALVGYTLQKSNTDYNSILVTHFTNEDLKQNNLADGSQIYPPASGASESTLKSIIGRVNYTYLSRYNMTLTFRADNSSRFAANHRWGYFPSVGLSWNVNQEKFFKDIKFIDNLKVRLSAGTVGNQEIGDYEYAESYKASRYNGTSSYAKSNLSNDNLKWETTASYNLGIDADFFHNRLNVTADAYYKKTSDLLLEVAVGSFSGVNTQLQNVGNVVNKGIEFSVNADLVRKKNLDWSVSANIAHNKNEITDMGSNNSLILGDKNELILSKGQPLGTFYGLVYEGVDAQGNIKYKDIDNNGTIDGNDRQFLGSIQPDFTYGISSVLQYHALDASIAFSGSQGNKLYNGLRQTLEHANDAYNVLSTYFVSDKTTSYVDSRYIEDASYLKLKNITLGYSFHVKSIQYIDKIRFFATAQNLITITKYKGYDPEVASGSDYGAYPSSRSFTFGVDLKF
jgi:TonB-dependent starch-binding outer membrane protein SusC